MADEPNDQRTVFMPPPGEAERTRPPEPAPTPPPATSWGAPPVEPPAGRLKGSVEVGDCLNHIYEVRRLIARGGMGAVYEGVNVNSDERVAIKVMLPHLAADPTVQAMFRKEAATLTRLSHPAVVPYRVLANEPSLGVLYIVTEYIDGSPLGDVLGEIRPSPEDLKRLLRRLAEGLRSAHELGAVHRDMSPDNVLLPGGRLEQAKIIDFGIAKDMDASKATIVGDGFAGKLGYVAPEQFGDFGREIGPWTDVYSLGLVILAAAAGKAPDMGATLVDAVDKRRAGPDLSAAPEALRSVLGAMLAADPAKRLRSMDEVIAMLDAPAAPPVLTKAPGPAVKPKLAKAPAQPRPSGDEKRKGPPLALIAGGVAALVLVGGGAAFLLRPQAEREAVATPEGSGEATNAPAQDAPAVAPEAAARTALQTALPQVGCSWLDLLDASAAPGGVALRLAGVAGSPAAAQAAVSEAVRGAGVGVSAIDLESVAPVETPVCAPLDAFRAVRGEGERISAAQRRFEMTTQATGALAGRAVITLDAPASVGDLALLGLEPSGKIDMILPDRTTLEEAVSGGQVTDLGGGRYRLQIDTDHPGWSGLLLITGKGPFDARLLAADAAARGGDWPARFQQAAARGGWRTHMVWYRVEDQTPG